MMITVYLRQTAIWHRPTGTDAYGKPTWESADIPVRWEGKRRLVRDAQGREVVSEARVFCVAAVQTGDELEYAGRRWPVINVATMPGLDGPESHREVAV